MIDGSGNLRRLYCPFKVICLINFPAISKGDKVSVDAIKLTVEVREVYIIEGIAYHIAYFRIHLKIKSRCIFILTIDQVQMC